MLTMPEMDGFALLEGLNQSPETASIPVIVVSAKDLSDMEKELLAANGVSSMWQKGRIDRKKLVEQVEAQLD